MNYAQKAFMYGMFLVGGLTACDKNSDAPTPSTNIIKPDISKVTTTVKEARGSIAEYAQQSDGTFRGVVDWMELTGSEPNSLSTILQPEYRSADTNPTIPDKYGKAYFDTKGMDPESVKGINEGRNVIGKGLTVFFVFEQNSRITDKHIEGTADDGGKLVYNLAVDTVQFNIESFNFAAAGSKNYLSLKKNFEDANQDFTKKARLSKFTLNTVNNQTVRSGYIVK